MTIAQVAALLPEPATPAPLPQTKVVRPLFDGNAARKPAPRPDAEDDLDWLEQSNAARRAALGLHVVRLEEAGGDD